MFINDKKVFLKYVISIVLGLWVVFSLHIFYLYIVSSSKKVPTKWGTLVEWWIKSIYPYPYTSNSDFDKFYQSLLYKSCLTPYVSWTKIDFKSDLCVVKTNNRKDFEVYLTWNYFWSDKIPITLDDIYFTYNQILKNNIWKLNFLNQYSSLKIKRYSDHLLVTFPMPSVDNLIFFTNFILPAHILSWKDLNYYITTFTSNPVVSNCAKLIVPKDDPDSKLFDLSRCKNFWISKYQYKKLSSKEDFINYVSTQRKKIIDFYFENIPLDWYKKEKFIYNSYLVIFYNVESKLLDLNFKRVLSQYNILFSQE